ncbi:NACHT nucleoside triphosphatase [Penicillium bovifimosum]|uniref:NACHT nucleoside triphosphatase n=1 Tax=Penicillium bovifimosum TaxID=126998 RepID=A0A9W9L315_9EURO|nr:NACHT nucleoside triphosphatase [Penicillium bovifimosum]KAJ5135840.1 NACHT nucleoside triphosphatase [Penicillium bovifimosum]
MKRYFPLAEYAAEFWTCHAVLAQAHEEIIRMIVTFLEEKRTFQRWTLLMGVGLIAEALDRALGYNMLASVDLLCLHAILFTREQMSTHRAACCFKGRSSRYCQPALRQRSNVNAQGGECGNALYAASQGGFQEIIKLLLDKGADINAQGGLWGNALQAASVEGDQERLIRRATRRWHASRNGGPPSSRNDSTASTGINEVLYGHVLLVGIPCPAINTCSRIVFEVLDPFLQFLILGLLAKVASALLCLGHVPQGHLTRG